MADLIPITFKATEEFSDWMCRQYGDLDLSRSEFIRQCVRIAAPLPMHAVIPEAGRGGRPLSLISEPGLYSLILRSRKPAVVALFGLLLAVCAAPELFLAGGAQ